MKKIIFTVAAVCCIALTSSCNKDTTTVKENIASYSLDGSGICYPTPKESVLNAFSDECNQVTSNFDGTSFTQDQYVTAIGVVVDKYNHKYLDGPFKVLKDSTVIKTFQMLMTVGYNTSDLIALEGKEDELTKFSNAVQAVVDKYHNGEYSNGVNECINEIRDIVQDYNYKDIQGSFKVWVGDTETFICENKMHFAL